MVAGLELARMSSDAVIGDDDPFSGDINFGVFVNETGGNLFFNRNDIDNETKRSQILGSEYYTLTHQPQVGHANGRFRRIRVTLRDPSLRVLTKAGYFAPDRPAEVDLRQKTMIDIAEAVQSTIPFQALDLTIEDLVRHPDTRQVEFTVVLKSGNTIWQPADSGKSTANVLLAAASMTGGRDILTSKLVTLTLQEGTQNPTQLAETMVRLRVRLRVSRKAEIVP
jgi:hypothetical protein